MINMEGLEKMYDKFIEGTELTTKELKANKFNYQDLNNLIEKGILKRIKRGHYIFTVDYLFNYGNKLIVNKKENKAISCFKKCYELDSEHIQSIFRLFSCYVLDKNYEEAFKYFDLIYNTDNEYYNIDNNLYIYLLSMITDVPEKHKLYTKYMNFDNIKVGEEVPEHALKNRIRMAILNQKFSYALNLLNELITNHNGKFTIQDLLIKELLREANNVKKESNEQIIQLVKQKQYQEIINFLNQKMQMHNLNLADYTTLMLCEDLINISKNKTVPTKKDSIANTVSQAVENYNYELALNLSNDYDKEYGIDNDNDIINILLNDICSLIVTISNSNSNSNINGIEEKLDSNLASSAIDTTLNNTPVCKTEILEEKNDATFADVVNYRIQADLDKAFNSLHSYLVSLNKTQYEFLIIKLIKLSLIENDIAFTKPMLILTNICRENFVFDISNYIQEFYIALAAKKLKQAEIYLDIITSADKLGYPCILTDNFRQVLEATKVSLNYHDDDINNEAEIASNSEQLKAALPVINGDSDKKTINEVNDTQQRKDLLVPSLPDYTEFINQKHLELQNNKEVILLDPMDDESIEAIQQTVESIPDMLAIIIGTGKNKRIVLKYKNITDQRVNFSDLIKDGKQAFNEKKYDDCIKNYQQVLTIADNPNSFIYSSLGLAYMKKWDKKKAIDYLTIANELNQMKGNGYDCSELIESLKGNITKNDRKPFVKLTVDDFDSNNNDYYGIENIDAIASLVFKSCVKLEEACSQFGLNVEQTCLVKLIFAQNYYTEELYELGDMLVKSVDKVKNKPKNVYALVDEVKKRKNFYKNRKTENFVSKYVLKK